MKIENIKTIAVAGMGLMGASIAQIFPQFGYKTILYSNCIEDKKNAIRFIKECHLALISNGILTEEKSKNIIDSIEFTDEKETFKEADIIIEAIPEVKKIKLDFFEMVSSFAKEDAIIASNTSAISIDDLSVAVKNPQRFIGTHWLNPPHIIPLVEVTKGENTSIDTVDLVVEILSRVGKEPVVLKKDVKGFLSNRLQFALLREATYLVESGVATPQDIDRTIKYGNGIRYTCSGPFKIVDLGGISVFNNVAKYLYPELSDEKDKNLLLEKMIENGCNGVQNKQGFYEYFGNAGEEEIRRRDDEMLQILKIMA